MGEPQPDPLVTGGLSLTAELSIYVFIGCVSQRVYVSDIYIFIES